VPFGRWRLRCRRSLFRSLASKLFGIPIEAINVSGRNFNKRAIGTSLSAVKELGKGLGPFPYTDHCKTSGEFVELIPRGNPYLVCHLREDPAFHPAPS
jgi:hypothetical protein